MIDLRARPRGHAGRRARRALQQRRRGAAAAPGARRSRRPPAARGRDRRLRGAATSVAIAGSAPTTRSRSLLGCQRDEIAVVENATRAWDMAFYSFRFRAGDRILTGRAEYASNWIALKQVADRTGAGIEVVPDDETARFDVAALEQHARRAREARLARARADAERARQPGCRGRRVTRAAGVPLLLDACQSVGQLPARRRATRLRHPLRHGPQVPARPARDGLPLRAARPDRGARAAVPRHARGRMAARRRTYTIRGDARRFENWETYYAGKVGLGVAVDYALEIGVEDGLGAHPSSSRAPAQRACRAPTA